MARFRVMTPDEIAESTPTNVSNESGVSLAERLTFNKLATNPETAKAFLRSKGYHVRPFGGGFNFAVQKATPGQEPDDAGWKVVDPKGFDPTDLLEIALEVPAAAAIGAGGLAGGIMGIPGGPVGVGAGAVGGAGLAGMAVETARQGLGQMAGVPQDYDPTQIASAGILAGGGQGIASKFGPATDEMLAATGSAARRVGNVAAEFAGKASRRPNYQNLSPGEQLQLEARALNTNTPLPTVRESVETFRQYATTARGGGGFQEADEVADLLKIDPNRRVDLLPVIQQLTRHKPWEMISEPTLLKNAENLIDNIGSALGVDLRTVKPTRISVPLPVAQRIKQELQEVASFGKAYVGQVPEKQATYIGNVEQAASMVRRALEAAVPERAPSGMTIGELNRIMSKKSSVLARLERKIGQSADAEDAAIRAGGEAEGSEGWVKNLFAGTREGDLKVVREFDRLFGTEFEGLFQSAVTRLGSVGGARAFTPDITATGLPLGMSVGGAITGGAPGMLGGALAGGMAAMALTPAGTLGITRVALGADRLLGKGFGKLAKVMTLGMLPANQRAAAINAFQQAMARAIPKDDGKAVIRQDAKRRELEGR